MSIVKDQVEFMRAADQEVGYYSIDQSDLYTKLIIEETGEWILSRLYEPDVNELKELVDILVVTLGKIISMGVDPQAAWDLVHANNMAKVTGPIVKDKNGKVPKSPKSIAAKAEMMESLDSLVHYDRPTEEDL